MRKLELFMLCLVVIMTGCQKLTHDDHQINDEEKVSKVLTKSGQDAINPYALSFMQEVFDENYGGEGALTLEPTTLYVKFLPTSIDELTFLEALGLDLFDYPLTLQDEAEVEAYLASVEEGELSWKYTTVKHDFNFPSGIECEIIEQCFIPEESSQLVQTKGNSVCEALEVAALIKAGVDVIPQTRASTPQGTINVYDTEAKQYVPVKGVKVRCHRFIKWGTGYTDANGHYTIDNSFKYRVHYALVFENSKGFDIWGNWGPLARAHYNMEWRSQSGFNQNISTDSRAWHWATLNNCAYDYYEICNQKGLNLPPNNLKIWHGIAPSAPMLRRIPVTDGIFFALGSILAAGGAPFAGIITSVLSVLTPDVTISSGSYTDTYYSRVCHELAHTSHFTSVGPDYWTSYVNETAFNGKRGGHTDVGEAWGHGVEKILYYQKYPKPGTTFRETPYPGGSLYRGDIVWNLVRFDVLTLGEIFDCLEPGINSFERLKINMINKYPDKEGDIKLMFDGQNTEIEAPHRCCINREIDIALASIPIDFESVVWECEQGDFQIVSQYKSSAKVKFSVIGNKTIKGTIKFVGDPNGKTITKEIKVVSDKIDIKVSLNGGQLLFPVSRTKTMLKDSEVDLNEEFLIPLFGMAGMEASTFNCAWKMNGQLFYNTNRFVVPDLDHTLMIDVELYPVIFNDSGIPANFIGNYGLSFANMMPEMQRMDWIIVVNNKPAITRTGEYVEFTTSSAPQRIDIYVEITMNSGFVVKYRRIYEMSGGHMVWHESYI